MYTYSIVNKEISSCYVGLDMSCEIEKSSLLKCEEGRRRLIDLECFPPDCSCDQNEINAKLIPEAKTCAMFRVQIFANPCFSK